MTLERIKRISQAIKALAQKDPRLSVNEIRIIVALERAIARLLNSEDLKDHLVFKGGFVLLKSYESLRFTRDVDALAVAISKDTLTNFIHRALAVDLDDGIWFGDIKVSVLEYEEPVTWRIYPAEYIVAEKIQTLFDRGSANSRSKDIYDLNYLFPRCKNRDDLISAIRTTFKNRGTDIPASFAVEASRFDKTILSNGWPGVQIFGKKTGFETAWSNLIAHLENLDH